MWGTIAKLIGKGALAVGTGGSSLALPGVGASSMVGDALGGFGKAAGGAAQAQASNRGTKAELMMDQHSQMEQELLRREMEKRTARAAAYRDAMVGSHAMGFEAAPRPAAITTPSYVKPNPGGQLAAGELFRQGNRRLLQPDLVNPGGMSPYQSLMENPEFMKTMKPGLWEKILGIAGVAAPAAGMFMGKGNNSDNSGA